MDVAARSLRVKRTVITKLLEEGLKIWSSVLCRHREQQTVVLRVGPVEIRRDGVGRDRILETAPVRIPLDHNLEDVAARSLRVKRTVITKLLEEGLYPYTKRYLGTFANHFSTIGLVGMNEVGLNARWLGRDRQLRRSRCSRRCRKSRLSFCAARAGQGAAGSTSSARRSASYRC